MRIYPLVFLRQMRADPTFRNIESIFYTYITIGTHSFIHLTNTYYLQDPVLGSLDISVNRTKIPALGKLIIK